MKKFYVAGALSNPDVTVYLKNVSKMLDVAEQVRILGCSVYIPAIDLLSGIKFGYYDYNDYFDNSQPWLDASDAVCLVPGWEESKGTRREIDRADGHGIPVFSNIAQIEEFIKPLIICIIGESGSGKTLMAETFENFYKYHLIQSYTTRLPRVPDENGHTFITEAQFDKFQFENKEMIAYTKFGAFRYCCLRDDVHDYNTYVIDETGLTLLKKNYSDKFHIYSIRVKADEKQRKLRVSPERLHRDKGQFIMSEKSFDFVYHNSYDMKEMITFVKITKQSIWADFITNCLNQ